MKDVSKNRRAAASSSGGSAAAAYTALAKPPLVRNPRRSASRSSGAASGNAQKRVAGFEKGRDRRRKPDLLPILEAGRTPRQLAQSAAGPCRGRDSQLRSLERRAVAARRSRRPDAAAGRRSAAACGDEDPVRVGRSSVARKGPVIGLLDWLPRSAIDDTSVHRARHVDLVRDQLECHLCRAAGKPSLDDVHLVELFDLGLQRFLGGDAFVDRQRRIAEKPRRSATAASSALSPFAKAATIISKAVRAPSMKCAGSKLGSARRIRFKPSATTSAAGPIAGRSGDRLVRFNQRCYVVGGGWRRASRKQVAAPLVSCPPAEHTAQPQHQKPSDHREQDDVEIIETRPSPSAPRHCPRSTGTRPSHRLKVK